MTVLLTGREADALRELAAHHGASLPEAATAVTAYYLGEAGPSGLTPEGLSELEPAMEQARARFAAPLPVSRYPNPGFSERSGPVGQTPPGGPPGSGRGPRRRGPLS